MPYPTQQELLEAKSLPTYWIDRHFLRPDPYAFSSVSKSFNDLACDIADSLEVDRNGVFCIGSGAVGLSLNPKKIMSGQLKRFGADSDLDLAVISSRYFDVAWRDLLEATQPHLNEIPEEIERNLTWQKKRLFDGAILTNKLLSSLSFGTKWLGAIDRIGENLATSLDRNVIVNLWIYRDYWSLRNYIARGVVACQQSTPATRTPEA